MADSVSGIGGGQGAAQGIGGQGKRPAASGRAASANAPAPPLPGEAAQRHYVHVEGRRFDLAAPRGTYLNILV